MPKVGKKHFPYTKKGIAKAKVYARKKIIKDAKRKKSSKFVSANGVKKLKPAVAGNMVYGGSVGIHNI